MNGSAWGSYSRLGSGGLQSRRPRLRTRPSQLVAPSPRSAHAEGKMNPGEVLSTNLPISSSHHHIQMPSACIRPHPPPESPEGCWCSAKKKLRSRAVCWKTATDLSPLDFTAAVDRGKFEETFATFRGIHFFWVLPRHKTRRNRDFIRFLLILRHFVRSRRRCP